MILLEPEPTPYDLRWRMFGIDVRVHPMFWLFNVILGWWAFERGGGGPTGLAYVALWVACVFVSILIHELGHVVAGRIFGAGGNIVLFSFGGLAIGSSNLPYRWQRVIVYLAGPGAQLIILGVLYLVRILASRPVEPLPRIYDDPLDAALTMLWFINLYWPLLNLLPIWPLDGGQVSRELCEAAAPLNGRRNSLIISLVVAGILVAHILLPPDVSLIPWGGNAFKGQLIMALFFGMFAFQSFQLLQEESGRRRNWEDDRLPWER